jgi:chromosome segregation ATPase
MSESTSTAPTPTAPVTTGNTILSPPRLSGDAASDTRTQQRWLQDLYDQLVKVQNVVGTQGSQSSDISDLQNGGTILTSGLAAANQNIANTASAVTILDTDVTTLQADIATLNGDFTTLQGELAALNTTVTALVASVNANTTEIAAIRAYLGI